MIYSTNRGNKIHSENGTDYFYSDGLPLRNDSGKINERPCTRCGKMPTAEGYDACKGFIKGHKSVCCGHGVSTPIMMENDK